LEQPLQQQWPHSDPCRRTSFSFPRFLLMATLFLCMTVGSLPLFFLLMKRPYGVQVASAIVYTIFAVFFTFARTGGRGGNDLPPYMFTCPAVQPQFFRLLGRHLGFLVALFALQTLALAVRWQLPHCWNIESRRGTLFHAALLREINKTRELPTQALLYALRCKQTDPNRSCAAAIGRRILLPPKCPTGLYIRGAARRTGERTWHE
jgi:hypothetical protein